MICEFLEVAIFINLNSEEVEERFSLVAYGGQTRYFLSFSLIKEYIVVTYFHWVLYS